MLCDSEIEARAEEFNLRPLDVQKDYVYGWLLAGLFQRPALVAQLVLKGGNALRKGYLPDTRFSKDLDFSSRESITEVALERELRQVCEFVCIQAYDVAASAQSGRPVRSPLCDRFSRPVWGQPTRSHRDVSQKIDL